MSDNVEQPASAGFKEQVTISDGASMTVVKGPLSDNPGETVTIDSVKTEDAPKVEAPVFTEWEVKLQNFPVELKQKIEFSCAQQKMDVTTVLTMMIAENFNTHRYQMCQYCGPEKLSLRKKAQNEARSLFRRAEEKRLDHKRKRKAAKLARKRNRG